MFEGHKFMGWTGKITVTNQRIIFRSKWLNIAKFEKDIDLSSIKEMHKHNALGVIPNGFILHTKHNEKYFFIMKGREKIVNFIHDRMFMNRAA